MLAPTSMVVKIVAVDVKNTIFLALLLTGNRVITKHPVMENSIITIDHCANNSNNLKCIMVTTPQLVSSFFFVFVRLV